jgi:tellurite resistance protein TerC
MDFLLPFLTADFMGKPAWVWLAFVGIVVALLAFDLGVLHKDDREIGVRESLLLSAGYISVALLFGAWVWWYLGAQSGMDYYTGFMIEKSLSMDNVFVIALIFSFFAIPRQYQHRVLFWGILGVIVLRAIMIGWAPRWSASSAGCCTCSAPSWSSPASRCGSLPTTCPTSRTTRC